MEVNKAIVAILGGVVTVAGIVFGADVSWATPELIAAVGSVLTSFLVWRIPNVSPSA